MKLALTRIENDPPKGLDKTAEVIDKEVWKEIDCLTCANCCKKMTPTFTGVSYAKIDEMGSVQWPCNAAAPEGAGGLLLNAMNVAPEAEKDFNDWYNEEHIPALAAVPGTMSARRFKAEGSTGGSHRYVAIYHLKTPEVTYSDAWKKAVDTPWSARIRPHFRDRLRILTRRYVRGA